MITVDHLPYVEEGQPSRLYLIAAMLRDSGQHTIAEEVEKAARMLGGLQHLRNRLEQEKGAQG